MRWKTTLVLLVLTVGVGAYVSLYEIKQPTLEEREQRAKEILRLAPEHVSRLQLTGPQGSLTLARDRQAWRLTSPRAVRADDAQVQQILFALNPLGSDRALGAREALSQYGLDPPKATLTATATPRSVTVLLGEKTPVGANRYLKLADAPSVYVAGASLFDLLNQPWDAYRSHDVVDFDTWTATQVAVESPAGAYTLRKEGDRWRLTAPLEDQADPDAASSVISKLRGLRVERFISDEEPAAERLAGWGLQAPASRITVTAEKREQPLQILIGAASDKPEEFYVKRTDEPSVYTVKKAQLDELFKDPQALRSHTVVEFTPADATKAQAGWQGASWTIERSGDRWRVEGAPADAPALDQSKVEDWLWKIRDLKLTRFADAPAGNAASQDVAAHGLDKPAGALRVWVKGQPDPTEVLIGNVVDAGTSSGRRYATLSGRRGIVELPEGIEPILATTPESFKAQPAPPTPQAGSKP